MTSTLAQQQDQRQKASEEGEGMSAASTRQQQEGRLKQRRFSQQPSMHMRMYADGAAGTKGGQGLSPLDEEMAEAEIEISDVRLPRSNHTARVAYTSPGP